jgi:RNA polymerase sigma-70 factor, ECF subfamily
MSDITGRSYHRRQFVFRAAAGGVSTRERRWPADIIDQMPLEDLSDEELVAEYRRAPPAVRSDIANQLFTRHYERVARWCFRLTGDRDAAADLAQDVFLKAHRHLDAFKGASRFSTWLYTIVRNEGLNRMQRLSPEVQDDALLADVAAATEAPDATVSRASRGKRLMAFLSETLDRTERTVFTLHYGDELPLDTITRLLSLDNASGAKAYIVSAKRKLARAAARLRARGETL